jgi:murein DD-endopeptidase MepM/ murein hydrolase activator NlpD
MLLFPAVFLSFQAVRSATVLPSEQQRLVESMRIEIQSQQRIVDRLSRQNEQHINGLAARIAELQAASTRLDALGERLAQMGQLTLDEFDFSEPAAIGGPTESSSIDSASESELQLAIAALSEKLHRQSGQLDALQFLMMNRQLEKDLTPTGWPVRNGWISSRYGERNDPFTGERTRHAGLDFVGTRGSDVLSVAGGVVIWSAKRAGYGNTVEIDHGNGYQTRYAHNDQLLVQPGDHVAAGDVIATLGDSGRASAPHVHFEVLQDGIRVNPAKFVGQLR